MFDFRFFLYFFDCFSAVFCTFAPMKTDKRKIVFIVNPISGTKSKEGLPQLIEKTLDAEKFEWSIVKTEYAGHAAEIVPYLKHGKQGAKRAYAHRNALQLPYSN